MSSLEIDPLLQLTDQACSQRVVDAFQQRCSLPVAQPDVVVLLLEHA